VKYPVLKAPIMLAESGQFIVVKDGNWDGTLFGLMIQVKDFEVFGLWP
jgi:hypothetical protein